MNIRTAKLDILPRVDIMSRNCILKRNMDFFIDSNANLLQPYSLNLMSLDMSKQSLLAHSASVVLLNVFWR